MQVSVCVILFSTLFVISFALPAIRDEETASRLKILSRVRRIVGGNETATGDWPWLVHVKGKIPTRTLFGWGWMPTISYKYKYCGGALLDKNHVLTAAHCFDGDESGSRTPKYWHVKAGDAEAHTHITDRPKSFFGRLFGRDEWITHTSHAEQIHIHPEYNPSMLWKYDAAIIKTEEEFPTENTDFPQIAAVKLPPAGTTSDWPANGQECVMKGWGCDQNGGGTLDVARAVILPKVPDNICRNTYGASTDSRLCAGYSMRDMGICSGDSGGPLVCKLDDVWTEAGIASFSAQGSPADHPAAFTRITEVLSFIRSHVISN